MTKRSRLAIAAAAALLVGGLTAAHAVYRTDGSAPSRYVQMNSPGDGISSGAARTGNGRARRAKRGRRMRHHR